MAQHTAPAPRVPHRVLETRSSFTQKPRGRWRGHLAIAVLVIGCSQLLIWVGHVVWVGEVQIWHWAFP